MRLLSLLVTGFALLAACGSTNSDTTAAQPPATTATPVESPAPDPSPSPVPSAVQGGELFPDVLAAVATQADDGSWSFDVTLSSPYDTPQRYADAWRVLDPEGNELGVRVLVHDHASEQPFTRSLSRVDIPDSVTMVTIEGRDIQSGWGGATVEVSLT